MKVVSTRKIKPDLMPIVNTEFKIVSADSGRNQCRMAQSAEPGTVKASLRAGLKEVVC